MKWFSYILIAAVAFVLAVAIVGADDLGADTYDISDGIDTPDSTSYTTYYDQLNDLEKSVYKAMEQSISKMGSKFKISNISIDGFKKAAQRVGEALQYDHPEYFWFTGGYLYSYPVSEDYGTVTVEPKYYQYASAMFDYKDKQSQLQSRVEEVAALARQHSSDDFERIMFVHDYLIKNAIYDHDALDEYYKTTRSPSCEYIFSAYGCLVNGKTVCSGYAKAFQLIMNYMGYDCSYVVGDAGEAHGWNCIYLDGEGYFVDVTWDDADFDKETPLYNYAFITSGALSKTHRIDMPFQTPVCNAEKYNYFIKNGYYLEKYDRAAAARILASQKGNRGAYIQLGSKEALSQAKQELTNMAILKYIDGMEKAYRVSYNLDHCTLSILLKD